ncbi:acylphosphatase [Gudongella sp. DL1XJH-153]|uniref:acylphosphatase n=1 Tax=Gudongella sp. DL1XJH-153 TaxID=3409804 RepID=UPI003BB7B4F4
MGFISEWQNNYVVKQVKNLRLPEFKTTEIRREEIEFSGKVQKVGFRLEVYELANRLGLTGWVENLPDGSVRAQFQGEMDRIEFLVEFMKSLKRAKVKNVKISELEILEDEKGFIIKE